ncbi:MAG: zinc ribbon domain-containing protein [Dehalococcoidia bacterium]
MARANRKGSRIHCRRCGFQIHADLNAAINIRDNYTLSSTERSEEQAVVNQPNVTDINLVTSYPPRGGSN